MKRDRIYSWWAPTIFYAIANVIVFYNNPGSHICNWQMYQRTGDINWLALYQRVTKWLCEDLSPDWYPNYVLFSFLIKLSSYRKIVKPSCRVLSFYVTHQLGLNCLISLEPTLAIGSTMERFIEFIHSFIKQIRMEWFPCARCHYIHWG